MAIKETRSHISRQAAEIAKAVDKINKQTTAGGNAPYKGGERTRKAFQRNTKKNAVIQDYDGVIPLSRSIQREMDADLREFAKNLEDEYEILRQTIGEERARAEIESKLRLATRERKALIADIEKKSQYIATHANLEFVKTAVGKVAFKKIQTNKVQRAKLVSFVGENGYRDVQNNSRDMFALITRESYKSKRTLADRFLAGLEGEEPVNLKQLVKEEIDANDTRARFIARDQTAKLNSITTANRMEQFGISIYQWIATTGDGRTRSLHLKRHLKYFMIGTPVARNYDGMPGIPPNCRCSMKPVVNEQQRLMVLTAIMQTRGAAYDGVAVDLPLAA